MKALHYAACILLAAALSPVLPANATSFSTDQSDLYYIAAEGGWGMQLVQRGSVIFATLFVYGPNGEPTWYTATLDNTSALTWKGTLYATAGGTYFESPWNPATLTLTPVGDMTWAAQTAGTGMLTYVVNGVTVIKNVVRQTLVLDDFSGVFVGGTQEMVAGCASAALNGPATLASAWDITQAGAAISIQSAFQNVLNASAAPISCTYTATLSQAGQFGAVAAVPFTCSDGSTGSISFSELQVTPYAISGSFAASYTNPQGCQTSGGFGGGRVTGP